jgi:hypothetical protein
LIAISICAPRAVAVEMLAVLKGHQQAGDLVVPKADEATGDRPAGEAGENDVAAVTTT